MSSFAGVFKMLREKRGWTQEEIAEKLKVSRPSIAGYESKGRIPREEMLHKIADLFGVSIDYLLGRTDEINASPPVPVIEEKEKDPNQVIAEKFLSYIHQGLTNEEISKRMDFMLDVFTLDTQHVNEFIEFVRNELKRQQQIPAGQVQPSSRYSSQERAED